jgi:hypothetical protein
MHARIFLVCGLLLPAGCQRLNYEKEYAIDPFEVKTIIFDPPRYEQKVTVEVKSPGSPVSVYLVKGEDAAKGETALLNEKAPTGALAGKDKSEDVNLEATIPAKTEYTLLVFNPGNKKSAAKVKVTGR